MAINYIISGNGTMTIVLNNESHSIGYDHPNYIHIKECLVNNDEESMIPLLNIPESILNYTDENVTIEAGVLKYKDEEIHNSLTERIMTMMRDGFPFQPMIKFLGNILENPSNRAVQELYSFLEHKNLPITEDGCFLAYKAVDKNYMDKYSGTIDNSVGQSVTMQRRKVDDNCNNGCSDGLHVGALDYVESYRNEGNEDKVVIVKVNPQDVVSVPTDSECQKVRCCSYEVVADYTGPLKEQVHHAQDGTAWTIGDFMEFMNMQMSDSENPLIGEDSDWSVDSDGAQNDYFSDN
tara:strand:- start:208 stop:1086 length:879 start_codon:yes stop_codon:yes gene_type:complete